MSKNVIICGLNGAGKTTLGRALAQKLGCRFLDVEELYFPQKDDGYPYEFPRSEQEVAEQLKAILQTEETLVFSSVTGKYIDEIDRFFQLCVILDVNKDIRIARVRRRSYEKFGSRIERGGDLYEKEEAFFSMVSRRDECLVNNWANTLKIPIIRLSGESSVSENVQKISALL